MRILHSLSKPEFILRPAQVFRRLAFELRKPTQQMTVRLPWDHLIDVDPGETVGSCIARQGAYDLRGCEAIWRLLDVGESALDVGANIGQMTSLMATKVGPRGKVYSFEPHPEIYRTLRTNCERWLATGRCGAIEHRETAVSENEGEAKLYMPPMFKGNNGVASLENAHPDATNWHRVAVSTLDAMFPGEENFGVMKIDIEGHELSALKGGQRLLTSRRIRDIVFEEHNLLPTPVSTFLTGLGYSLFYIDSRLSGPRIIPVNQKYSPNKHDAPNYLATLEPSRATGSFRSPGWATMRPAG